MGKSGDFISALDQTLADLDALSRQPAAPQSPPTGVPTPAQQASDQQYPPAGPRVADIPDSNKSPNGWAPSQDDVTNGFMAFQDYCRKHGIDPANAPAYIRDGFESGRANVTGDPIKDWEQAKIHTKEILPQNAGDQPTAVADKKGDKGQGEASEPPPGSISPDTVTSQTEQKQAVLADARRRDMGNGMTEMSDSTVAAAQVDGGEGISPAVAKQVAMAKLRTENVAMSEFGQAGGVGPASSVPIFNGPKGNSIA